MIKVIWDYFKELIVSFYEENIKAYWQLFSTFFTTIFMVLTNPIFEFPLPKKQLLDISNAEILEDFNLKTKKGYFDDIHFTKNIIFLLVLIVVGDTFIGDEPGQETENMIFQFFLQAISLGMYFFSFFVFLGIGRFWLTMFGTEKLKNRRVDGWFSMEFNSLFLLIFGVDVLLDEVLSEGSRLSLSLLMLIFAFFHLFYFVAKLRTQASEKIGAGYYWGVNVLFVFVLTITVSFVGIAQGILKSAITKDKKETIKKIEDKNAEPNKEENKTQDDKKIDDAKQNDTKNEKSEEENKE